MKLTQYFPEDSVATKDSVATDDDSVATNAKGRSTVAGNGDRDTDGRSVVVGSGDRDTDGEEVEVEVSSVSFYFIYLFHC